MSCINFDQVLMRAERVNTKEELISWINNEVYSIFSHKGFIGYFCSLDNNGFHSRIITIDFQIESSKVVFGPISEMCSQIIKKWEHQKTPQMVDKKYLSLISGTKDISYLKQVGIENIAMHGSIGLNSDVICFYGFFNVLNIQDSNIRNYLILLQASIFDILRRISLIFGSKPQPNTVSATSASSLLTRREYQIAYWIAQGKTNWEISMILGICDTTVKTHIRNIMNKLDINSRILIATSLDFAQKGKL